MDNFSDVANSMIIYGVNLIILLGEITIVLGAITTIVNIIRRKKSRKENALFLIGTVAMGITTILAGLSISYIFHYDIIVSCTKKYLPSWLFLMIVAGVFLHLNNKGRITDDEKNTNNTI